MLDPVALKRIDRQIIVVADLMDQYRHLIKRLRSEGRDAEPAQAALDALWKVFRNRFNERIDIEQASRSMWPRRASR